MRFSKNYVAGQVHGHADSENFSNETAIKAHCCQSPIVNDAKLCVLFSYTHVMAIKITSVTVQLPFHPLFYGFRQWKRQSGKLILEIFSPFNPETFRVLLFFHLSAWCRSLKLCLNIISEVVYRATIGRRERSACKRPFAKRKRAIESIPRGNSETINHLFAQITRHKAVQGTQLSKQEISLKFCC